ncbi:hypothetical protein BSR28_06030 [Boudabousia liubingyangii]|nr:hypothetical protein BSR28_06030 [Boudabousia liubingyangii]
MARRDLVRYNEEKLSVVIYLGYDCNLGCPYCYENGIARKQQLTMSNAAAIIKSINMLLSNHVKMLDLCFIGGEPLMYRDIYETIFDSIQKPENYSCQIVTNGTLLDREAIESLVRRGIWDLQITLDGDKESHDASRPYLENPGESSFADIMKNIHMIEAADPRFRVTVNCNLSEYTTDGVPGLLEALQSQNFRGDLVFSYVFQAGSTDFEGVLAKKGTVWRDCVLQAEKYGYHSPAFRRVGYVACPMYGDDYYIVGPDGYTYSCLNGIGRFPYKAGLFSNPFSSEFRYFRAKRIEANPTPMKICRYCEYLSICHGNCTYLNENNGFDCPKKSWERNEKEVLKEHIMSDSEIL